MFRRHRANRPAGPSGGPDESLSGSRRRINQANGCDILQLSPYIPECTVTFLFIAQPSRAVRRAPRPIPREFSRPRAQARSHSQQRLSAIRELLSAALMGSVNTAPCT
jgi:hypothetical protein